MAYATFNKPSLHFNTKLFTGTGSTNAQTGVGFQPDMVWFKNRSEPYSHQLYDVVRGVTKRILPDLTTAEETDANGLTAFGTDGFTVGSNVGVNKSSNNICSWNWKAGNSQGSSNTDGTINTTYTSVNTAAGFSISTFTGNGTNGATIGHGLGVVPQTVWIKRLSNVDGLIAYHASYGNNASVKMDREGASEGNFWNSTTPTSSVVTVTNSTENNTSGQTYVMYAFAEKKGYSKFGKYIGNGNANGTLIYTGFKPAFIMIKNISAGSTNWQMYDNKRDGFNPQNDLFRANLDSAEGTSTSLAMNILSNGFKINNTDTSMNSSGQGYIYMAFADVPLVASNGDPATAR